MQAQEQEQEHEQEQEGRQRLELELNLTTDPFAMYSTRLSSASSSPPGRTGSSSDDDPSSSLFLPFRAAAPLTGDLISGNSPMAVPQKQGRAKNHSSSHTRDSSSRLSPFCSPGFPPLLLKNALHTACHLGTYHPTLDRRLLAFPPRIFALKSSQTISEYLLSSMLG